MKRTKLCNRVLPAYSRGEEVMNMVTHIVGEGLAAAALALCMIKVIPTGSIIAITANAIYGCSMVLVYAMSSIYHGLRPGTAKKVMQVLDHCSIYLLIAGTYTPIVLCAMAPVYPTIGWGLFAAEWILAIIATILTAIDLHRFRTFSMICYIGMGWCVIFFLPQTLAVMTATGFRFLFAGGIAYTIGAILFGLGQKLKWMHSIFHIFVVLGSLLQFLAVFFYAI